MRIQHNIMAMSAYRNYNNNTKALSGNLEKLSSGYKINRAGDDAAGLAISEKMRAQITGLDAAQKNVKDGISLVKTAEGAMQEIQDMLNRMDYLATQSANGTYDNEVDRLNLQKEVDQLKTEINRIADSANFNGIKLLDGSLEEGKEIVTPASVKTDFSAVTTATSAAIFATSTNNAGVIGTDTVLYEDTGSPQETKMSIDLSAIKWTAAATGDTMTITIGNYSLTVTSTSDGEQSVTALFADAASADAAISNAEIVADVNFNVEYKDGKLEIELADDPNTINAASLTALNPNWTVTVGVSAGTSEAQWNAGTIEMTPGKQGHGVKMANTTFDLTKAGFNTTAGSAAENDGYTFSVDGTAYVLAVGNDSNWKGQDGLELEDGTKVKVVEVGANDTAAQQAAKLANAINKGSDVWEVGLNASGSGLTFKQLKESEDKDVQKALSTDRTTFAGIFKTGKATATPEAGQTTQTATGKALTLQIGDTSDPFNQMNVSVGDMHTKAMGTAGGQSIADINIGNQEGAAKAIQVIKDAINYVSGVRGDLGAIQNRLEHTGNNLAVMAENIQDAESTIRDTDVANEMMSYVKNNILVQSAQAMLAQANQVPQGVLQLLG